MSLADKNNKQSFSTPNYYFQSDEYTVTAK